MSPKNESLNLELLLKAERFCAYRERCSSEVVQKLIELGAGKEEAEKILSELKENDYLSDERFARLFVSGKFRIKRWGKIKIRAELKIKKLPDTLIYDALDTIDETEYLKTIEHLVAKKAKEVKAKDKKDKTRKVGMYILSKGFESELVWKILKSSVA